MSEYLPYERFKWLKNVDEFDVMPVSEKSSIGCFFKLLMNSVYGKTMESIRKRINVRLVNKAEDFLKYTSKPTYIIHKIFG